MDRTMEPEVDEQEGWAIVEIRKALSGTEINVSQYGDDNGFFSDIDTFVKLSEGNTSITKVNFFAFDKEGDDVLWEKVGIGLANLKSLTHFFVEIADAGQEINEPTPQEDFSILGLVLPYLRQNLYFVISTPVVLIQEEVQVRALARAIRRHPTIKEFDRGVDFPVETFHIILSALATLPSLEVVHLGLQVSEGSRFEHPEDLKKLMLSPSLREVYFQQFTFCRRLCRALEEALRGESNIALLSFEGCSLSADAGDRVARALKQNTKLTTVSLSGNFPQAFYDAFAAALLINTTLTKLELEIPEDEGEAALISPVLFALGMNKGLKRLEIAQHSESVDGQVYNAIRDGLEKNSTLEMLYIRTIRAEEFSISLLSNILPFLRVSTTLKSLEIIFKYDQDNPHVATSCLAIVTAMRENSSLETLEIYSDSGIALATYMTALESLNMNTTLKKLCLSPVLASFGNDEMKRVVSLVKKNYVLTELDEGLSVHDKTGELGSILRLNRAGRRYLIDDAGSIPKGVEVLIDVKDDLGCLFYHLLENPTLCDIECQYKQPGVPAAKGGSHGTKRARLTH